MASCENCGTMGIDPKDIMVVQARGQCILIGPCCYIPTEQWNEKGDLSYGLEISSAYGILAYAEYEGLKVEFRKTPDQVKKLYKKYFGF